MSEPTPAQALLKRIGFTTRGRTLSDSEAALEEIEAMLREYRGGHDRMERGGTTRTMKKAGKKARGSAK